MVAWLLHQGKTDVAITEDSDAIAYGCHTVRSSSSTHCHPPSTTITCLYPVFPRSSPS